MMDLSERQVWIFDMVSNILIEVLGTIAEQERETTLLRQEEGIAAAQAKGKKSSRPTLKVPVNWEDVIRSWRSGEITAKAAMEKTHNNSVKFTRLKSSNVEEYTKNIPLKVGNHVLRDKVS